MIETEALVQEEAPAEEAEEADEGEGEDESSSGKSDAIAMLVFFANVGMLVSFVVSLLLLESTSNFGGVPMIFSMIVAVPVMLLNVKVFMMPPKDWEPEDDEEFSSGQEAVPYVIFLVMIVILCIVYAAMSLHH